MEKPLTGKDWSELQKVLHGRDCKWQAIGIQLHVEHDELARIKREHGQNLEECNREMQIAWLKSGKATWRALVEALGSGPVGLLEDAKRLEEKHLRVGVGIQSAAASGGSHGDQECNPEKLVVNQQMQKSLLNEQLEWLVKMGFTVEDIMEWAQTKKKKLHDDNETINNSSSNNNNSMLPANPESTQQPNSDSTLLTSSARAHTEPSRLQEIPSTPSPSPGLSDLSLSLSIPVDRVEAHTPNGAGKKTLTRGHPRKRANSSQGKQPKAKRGQPSKASPMVAAALRKRRETGGGEVLLCTPSRLSVKKSRQRAITLLKEEMMQVLEKIQQHPAAEEFIEPVDRERAANYYDVITEPMCLTNMATKVLEGVYKTPKMFCDDFDLIVSNCEAYNGVESEYMQQARELEVEFYDLVDIYFDDSEIDVERHRSKTVVISPPREPTSTSNTGREGSPKKPSATGGGSLAANFMQDEECEETLSNQAYGSEVSSCITVLCTGEVEGGSGLGEEMAMGGQLPHTHSGTAASSDDDTVGDSEDDLPSFRDIFSTPSKI